MNRNGMKCYEILFSFFSAHAPIHVSLENFSSNMIKCYEFIRLSKSFGVKQILLHFIGGRGNFFIFQFNVNMIFNIQNSYY